MSNSEFSSASDFLDDNYEKVLEEYTEKNKERGLTYRIARGPAALGIMVDALFILVLVISYVLYKLQLPFELILFSLIGVGLIYRLCTLIVMPELDILGEPDIPTAKNANPFDIASSLSLPEPSHTVYIDFIKTFKLVSYSVCFAIILISAFVYYLLESNNILITFIIIILAYLVYYIAFALNILEATVKRDTTLGYELIEFAKEVKENS